MVRRVVKRLVGILLGVRNRHILLGDLVIFAIAPAAALLARTETAVSVTQFDESLLVSTLAFGAVNLAVFWRCRLYNRLWRYASIDELIRIAIASAFALALHVFLFFMILRPRLLVDPSFPRSIPILAGLISFPLVTATRVSARVAQRIGERVARVPTARRAVIAGAGEAGMIIVEELQSKPELGIEPVAWVDDDPNKRGQRIRGLQVLGPCGEFIDVARRFLADLVVVAMPAANGSTIRSISEAASAAGLEVRVIPGICELIDGRVSVSHLRRVQVEDLLRRNPVRANLKGIWRMVADRRILITGAGGSIGSELCRQIHLAGPSAMLLIGHGENSIFDIEEELASARPGVVVRSTIADIRDIARMDRVFDEFRPDLVFHAAAHKHVPLMERNPEEAVTNNILGTRNLVRLAERYGVRRFTMLSTDKAVNPSSVMGATKRVAEMIVHERAAATGSPFMAVRFGNVLGSRGSVLETFRKQIAAGGPVTVTDPEMKRYFMTIPEAVQLVLEACALGVGGEVFALDMGEPVRILDLARDVIRLSGLTEGEDIRIEVTGARSGEKLFEELFSPQEEFQRTAHEKILVCRPAMSRAESLRRPVDFDRKVELLIDSAQAGDQPSVTCLLKDLVPEYAPPPVAEHGVREALFADHRIVRKMAESGREVRVLAEGGYGVAGSGGNGAPRSAPTHVR